MQSTRELASFKSSRGGSGKRDNAVSFRKIVSAILREPRRMSIAICNRHANLRVSNQVVEEAGNEIMPFPLHKINFVAFVREPLGIFPRNQRLLGHANWRVLLVLVSRYTKKDRCKTYLFLWSGKRDSNSRHLPWQGNALPLSHSRIIFNKWWEQQGSNL